MSWLGELGKKRASVVQGESDSHARMIREQAERDAKEKRAEALKKKAELEAPILALKITKKFIPLLNDVKRELDCTFNVDSCIRSVNDPGSPHNGYYLNPGSHCSGSGDYDPVYSFVDGCGITIFLTESIKIEITIVPKIKPDFTLSCDIYAYSERQHKVLQVIEDVGLNTNLSVFTNFLRDIIDVSLS